MSLKATFQSITRRAQPRHALIMLAALCGVLLLGSVPQAQQSTTATTATEPDIERMSTFYADSLSDDTRETLNSLYLRLAPRIIPDTAVAVRKYDPDGNLLFSLTANEDRLYPVASGFKGFLALFYLLTTPEDEWQIEPLSNVHSMVAFSNNVKTGRVLEEVGIEAFNDFLLDEIDTENGIGRWSYTRTVTDDRFTYQPGVRDIYLMSGRLIQTNNAMTMNDLIKGYEYLIRAPQDPRWQTDEHWRHSIETAIMLMSVRAEDYPTPFESIVRLPFSYGKEGSLRPDDGLGIIVLNETIIIPTTDGSSLMVSLMTANVSHARFRDMAERILNWVGEIENSLNPDLYNLEFQEYPELVDTEVGQTYYGFVIPSKVDIYTDTRDDAVLENYYRGTYTMPVAYIFQGALMRFELLADGWVRIIEDHLGDEAFDEMLTTPYSGDVYMKLEDLHVVDFGHFAPIDRLYPGNNIRFMIIDKASNTLSLFEGDNIVLNTPIVLNKQLTEEGMHLINTNMTSLNMAYYPGVPFVMNFGINQELGIQAIHGAPWQKSNLTLRNGVAETRITGGCVNLPNWTIDVGEYEMPVDEFIFRWSGGMNDPRNIYEYRNDSSQDVVRVIVVNGYDDLTRYYRAFQQFGTTAGNVFRAIEETPLNVPDYYYNTFSVQTPPQDDVAGVADGE